MPSTTSEVLEVTAPTLLGVWIHDPDDAAGTEKNFMYGGIGRGSSVSVEYQTMVFAGRVHPVAEFGEHENWDADFTLNIPYGTSWRSDINAVLAFARSRKTLLYRDGRGRRMYGVIPSADLKDSRGMEDISIMVQRVDFDETAAAEE